MRRIDAPVQARLRWLAFELQVEPRIALRIEPRLRGGEHEGGMGGGDELQTDPGVEDGTKVPESREYRTLPSWMKVALHLVKQHDCAVGGMIAAQV